MKDRSCYFISEFANMLMIYIIGLTLLISGQLLIVKSINIFPVIAIALELGIAYFCRAKIANFILYAVIHIAVGVGLFFVPGSFGKIAMLVAWGVITILDISFWMKKRSGSFAYVSILFVIPDAIAYLVASVKKNHIGMILFFAFGLAFFVLYYLRLFFQNAHKLAKEGEEDETMPFAEMLKNGSIVAAPVVIISAVVMLIVKVDFFDKYALALYNFVADILGKVTRLILQVIHWIMQLFVPSKADEAQTVMDSVVEMQTNPVLRVISVIVYFLAVALLLFLFIKAVIALLKLIPMNRKITEQVIEKEDMVEIRQSIAKTEREKTEKLSKIRRIYKKTIERAAKKGYAVNLSQTPMERAADLEKKKGEKIGDLSRKYEEARYR